MCVPNWQIPKPMVANFINYKLMVELVLIIRLIESEGSVKNVAARSILFT